MEISRACATSVVTSGTYVELTIEIIGCNVLLLIRENLRLKNSCILAKTWLCAPKITRPKKLRHYFPIIINIFLYHGHKNKQKTKNIFIGVHPGHKFAVH